MLSQATMADSMKTSQLCWPAGVRMPRSGPASAWFEHLLLAMPVRQLTSQCVSVSQEVVLGPADVRLQADTGAVTDCAFKNAFGQSARVTDLQVRNFVTVQTSQQCGTHCLLPLNACMIAQLVECRATAAKTMQGAVL